MEVVWRGMSTGARLQHTKVTRSASHTHQIIVIGSSKSTFVTFHASGQLPNGSLLPNGVFWFSFDCGTSEIELHVLSALQLRVACSLRREYENSSTNYRVTFRDQLPSTKFVSCFCNWTWASEWATYYVIKITPVNNY